MMTQGQQIELLARSKQIDGVIFDEKETRRFRYAWVEHKKYHHVFGRVMASSLFDAVKKTVAVNDVLDGQDIMDIQLKDYCGQLALKVFFEGEVELCVTEAV